MTGSRERLTLDGVDGTRLHLRGPDGRDYTLEVDDPVAEAVRRTRGPDTGSEEVTVTTHPQHTGRGGSGAGGAALRPRDIQARVRAGASAEEIAEATGVAVEKVAVYARPVLAERAHMAQRAQRSSVRVPGGEGGQAGHRTLGDAVERRLQALDADPDAVVWDARKREDGRWVLTASYDVEAQAGDHRAGTARFTYDPPGNFVTLDDDDARWLLGDAGPATPPATDLDAPGQPADPATPAVSPASPTVPDDAAHHGGDAAAGPRLVAVADEQLPLGGVDAVAADADQTETSEQEAVTDEPEDADGVRGAGDDPDDPDDGPSQEPPQPRRRGRKRGGRASVPSWDEIMFGGGKRE